MLAAGPCIGGVGEPLRTGLSPGVLAPLSPPGFAATTHGTAFVDGAKRTQYPNLHEEGITTIAWLSDTSVVTGGNDGQIRTFEFCA